MPATKKRTIGVFVLMSFCASLPLRASELNIHGFFNAVAGRMSNERIRYGDYEPTLSVDNESNIGIQMHMQAREDISVVGQLLGKTNTSDAFNLEWAYMDMQLTPSQLFRVGKTRAPFYLFSESLNVSYSYPWIRPPIETYELSSSIKVDGLHYFYRQGLSPHWDFSSQLYYGGYRGDVESLSDSAGTRLKKFSGIVLNLENDWARIRLGYHQASVTAKLDTLEQGGDLYNVLDQYGQYTLIDELRLYDKKGRFYGLALDINKYQWQWLSEYTVLRLERGLLPTHRSWYSMVAYQWRPQLLFHFTYSRVQSDQQYYFTSTDANAQAYVDAALLRADSHQHSLLFGARYEVKDGLALKLEWQRFFVEHNQGNLLKTGDTFLKGHSDLFNVALNLAF